jgi:hypothetical protein
MKHSRSELPFAARCPECNRFFQLIEYPSRGTPQLPPHRLPGTRPLASCRYTSWPICDLPAPRPEIIPWARTTMGDVPMERRAER